MAFNKRFQTLTQAVGLLSIVALALYGLFSLFGYATPFVTAQERAVESALAIPATFNYQGILRLQNGTPIDGSRDIVARLWDDPVNGTAVYSETYDNVNVRAGMFNIVLGDAVDSADDLLAAFETAPLFLELEVDGVVQLPRERLHAVPWALYSLNGGVPVGGIMDWMPPAADAPLPDGFLICNGQTVDDPRSPFDGMALPDFNERYAFGTTDPALAGQTGGSSDTAAAGAHSHATRNWNPAVGLTDGGGNGLTFALESFTNGQAVKPYYSPVAGTIEYTDTQGDHTHTFAPPFVRTVKLCRVY